MEGADGYSFVDQVPSFSDRLYFLRSSVLPRLHTQALDEDY